MSLKISLKARGKKRALDDSSPTKVPTIAPDNEPPHPTKRAKRAETRQCPVCDEHIPLRLLAKHALLESERVEDVIKKVGSLDPFYDERDNEPGPSSKSRRSAIKARKSITTRGSKDALDDSEKTIQAVKRHRKRRHTRLKEMAKEEEEGTSGESWLKHFTGEEITCPICSMRVRGDRDVVEAHVDACLANESHRQEEARQRELQHRQAVDDENWDEDEDGIGNYVGNLRGAGFHTRRQDQDVDDEIDIDGDDQAVFGEAQFTEGDVVPVNSERADVEEDVEVDIEADEEDDAHQEQKTLRDLIVAGKVTKLISHSEETKLQIDSFVYGGTESMDLAIASARQRGDKASLIVALENKIKLLGSLQATSVPAISCRICLDPYSEPTVSTGCWHTCCRECWLRCLGSTKLCPICKRITGATDLRRVYL